MRSETISSVSNRRVVLAGRVVAALGALHLAITGALNLGHLPAWFNGEMWLPANGLSDLTPAQGAFWLVVGSFAVPLLAMGLLIAWLGRAGLVPPAYVAWLLGGWGTVGALVLEPSPFLLTWVPAIMLLRAGRSQG
ncbi:hypothetical protein [Nonomuraea sp. NPDC050310]|uniref:hypothetical protein n=1 Tax=Nonomuraea sp. NPDC050310 TaxID=3154935 RepID=UPI0033CC6839